MRRNTERTKMETEIYVEIDRQSARQADIDRQRQRQPPTYIEMDTGRERR